MYAEHTESNKREAVCNLASFIPDRAISSPASFFGIHRLSVRNSLFCPQSWTVWHRRRDFIISGKSSPRSPDCSLSQVGRADRAVAIETNVGKPCAEPSKLEQ